MQKRLQAISQALIRRYGSRGRRAAENLRHWLTGDVVLVDKQVLERHLSEEHLDLLFDAFWQPLPFGTGGRRGQVGYGYNRMNETTVAMTVQGHCDYLREAFPSLDRPSVVVANDVRVFHDIGGVYGFLGSDHPLLGASSRSFAVLACEIYAGNGVIAYLESPDDPQALLSTPELSFAIAELGTQGGVILSASHNPPDDNGIKVYDQYGSQPIAPDDQHLLDKMRNAASLRRMPFRQALAAGLIRPLPEHLHQRYLESYVALYGDFFTPRDDMPIVYTPLCGCGGSTVGHLLRRLGFPVRIPHDQHPDGRFTPIPFRAPNPEVPESTAPAKAFADQQGSGIVLSSDPDADRVGLEVKLSDGSWYHMDGNQIASIIAYALMLDPQGPGRKGLVMETLVTTRLVGEIARRRGESPVVDDLRVGFKYMADVMKSLRRTGHFRDTYCSPDQLVLATEESHGVIVIPTILDKDATGACMFLAGLYQRLRAQGRTLLDYYVDILEDIGGYATTNRSIMLRGAEGLKQKDQIMESLRSNPPTTLAGHEIQRVVDHWDEDLFGPLLSETDRLPRNLLVFYSPRLVVAVRPSGTEPKQKFYCHILPDGSASGLKGQELLDSLRREADKAGNAVYNELLAIIGKHLDEPALLMPDIVELHHKLDFQENIAPELLERVSSGEPDQLEQILDWLGRRSSGMLSGADALPALKKPILCLVQDWPAELRASALCRALRDWASSR